MITETIGTHTPALFEAAVDRAATLLRRGEVVALPTETVYGLAANALDTGAVEKIFAIKGRPPDNPIIVHVAGMEQARGAADTWPPIAEQLARSFWPGPLTLVLVKNSAVPAVVTAGGPTVGIRWPAHPFAQAVIRACGFPLAAPSANLSTRTSPTRAEHVRQSLDGLVPLIVDGGPCQVGIESTVVDLVAKPPVVLRPGMISASSLQAVVGVGLGSADGDHPAIARSPGMRELHYAPKAAVRVLDWADDKDLEQKIRRVLGSGPSGAVSSADPCRGRRICLLAHTRVPSLGSFHRVSVVPHDPEAFGRALYAELHRCDEEAADMIVIEAVPNTDAWQGIADRLRRAGHTAR